MSDLTERTDKVLDDFYDETGIWPPGRDAAAAMGDPYDRGFDIAHDAYLSWLKQRAEIKRLRAALHNVVDLARSRCTKNAAEVMEQARDALKSNHEQPTT